MTSRVAAKALSNRFFSAVDINKGIATTYRPLKQVLRRDAIRRWADKGEPKYRHSGMGIPEKIQRRKEKLALLREEGKGPPKKGEGKKAKIRKK